MNKIFKVIWNRTTQSLVVTSELAKGQVKSSTEGDASSAKPLVAGNKLFKLSTIAIALFGISNVADAATAAFRNFSANKVIVISPSDAVNEATVETGNANSARGNIAIGSGTTYAGKGNAIAIGVSTRANGNGATAMGNLADASATAGAALVITQKL